MTTRTSSWLTQPYTQFKRSETFYLKYDFAYLVGGLAALALLKFSGFQGLTETWDWRLLFLLPLACHGQILASVFIHNCAHGNFPRPINRLVGEICGIVVLTRYASWEIIHQRHHKYSDDEVMDPHPIVEEKRGYWPFLWKTIVGVEQQLQTMFFERFGKTAQHRRFQIYRSILSFSTSFVILPICWALLLGTPAFVMVFVPATLVGFFHLIHFNWSTHNPWSPEADFRPVNLNHGFYRVGNWLWHGIYFHANHHHRASVFNPSKMDSARSFPVIYPGDLVVGYPRKKTKAAPVHEELAAAE